MAGVGNLRCWRVKEKGPLHARLHKMLHDAWVAKDITQESLARAIGGSQENAGQYLRAQKAGALDLDEAAAALRHVGSSLADFVAKIPPKPPTPAERIARQLEGREDLIPLVEALLGVPRPRLSVVIGQIDAGVFAATGRRLLRSGEAGSETKQASRTTTASKRRR